MRFLKTSFCAACVSIILILSVFNFSVSASSRVELVPSITITQQYDDNIYLDKGVNKKWDNITIVTPGINISRTSKSNGISLDYAPSFVKYYEHDENDTVRHRADLSLWQNLGRRVKFSISDTFLKSDDIFEEQVDQSPLQQRFRNTRKNYYRNYLDGSLDISYTRTNHLIFGYNHRLLENSDTSIDDGTSHGPYMNIINYFNKTNRAELSYQYSKNEFERDDSGTPGDDFEAHDASGRFYHSFSGRTDAYIGYGFSNRDFEGNSEDYNVHSALAGLIYNFEKQSNILLEAGYYKKINSNDTPNLDGFSYLLGINKAYRRGSISLRGEGGWDEDYLGANRTEFTRYWAASLDAGFYPLKHVRTNAGLTYRRNKTASDINDDTYIATAGLSYIFLRWYSVGLDYQYINRRSDNSNDEYVDNRFMVMFSVQRPFRSHD